MKKITLLSLVLLLLLVGCAKTFTSISKRFTNAGYSYDEEISSAYAQIVSEYPEDVTVTPHVFTSGLKIALILEFSDVKKMNEAIEESPATVALIKDFEKTKLINGNCLLIPFGLTAGAVNEMINIFTGETTKK